MTPAQELAAALAGHGVIAIPEEQSVRAWIAGTGTGWVSIVPGDDNGQPVWSWRHAAKTGAHPRGNIPGAAAKLTRLLSSDPP